MKVAGKKIAMFRCVKDPMIGPKPRQAFTPPDYGWTAVMTENEGIHITTDKGEQHFIGAGNIESVRFLPEELPTSEFGKVRRGPGARKAEVSGAI